MKLKVLVGVFILLPLLFTIGCTSKIQSEDAVKKAIMDYLASRPGLELTKMDVSITKVVVNGDHAEADVKFQVKNSGPLASMEMHYTVVREGGTWKVQASPGGHAGTGAPHGDGGAGAGTGGAGKAGSGPGFHPDTTKQ